MYSDVLDQWLQHYTLVILDGAMGTELERRGYRTTLPLWSAMANIEAPELVHQIHCDYIIAGADIITANTFRTTRYTFAKAGNPDLAGHCTRLAVELAREAILQSGHRVMLAGSIAPLEDCYSPELVPSADEIEAAYTHEIEILTQTDIDFVLVETMINLTEALILARLLNAKAVPYMLSFTTDGADRLLDGTQLTVAVQAIAAYSPSAILVNCRPVEAMSSALKVLGDVYSGPIGVYANGGGHPDTEIGWRHSKLSVATYMEAAQSWRAQKVQIIGGCCGTTPEVIRALKTSFVNDP